EVEAPETRNVVQMRVARKAVTPPGRGAAEGSGRAVNGGVVPAAGPGGGEGRRACAQCSIAGLRGIPPSRRPAPWRVARSPGGPPDRRGPPCYSGIVGVSPAKEVPMSRTTVMLVVALALVAAPVLAPAQTTSNAQVGVLLGTIPPDAKVGVLAGSLPPDATVGLRLNGAPAPATL